MNDLTAEEWKMTKTRATHVTIFTNMIPWHAPHEMCWNHQISKIGRPRFPSNCLKDRHARVMSQSCSTETRVTLTFENVSVQTITKISKWPSKGFCVKNVRFISFKNVWFIVVPVIDGSNYFLPEHSDAWSKDLLNDSFFKPTYL